MNLADEMNLHVGSFLRHRQGSMGSLFCQSDVLWTVPDVRLYPPAEGKGVTVRVVGPGSIKLNRLSGLDSQWEGLILNGRDDRLPSPLLCRLSVTITTGLVFPFPFSAHSMRAAKSLKMSG